MYCRQCRYDLRLLPGDTCPECGTTFDQSDPSTYLDTPRQSLHIKRATVVQLVLAYVCTSYMVAAGNFLYLLSCGWDTSVGEGVVLPVIFLFAPLFLPLVLVAYLIALSQPGAIIPWEFDVLAWATLIGFAILMPCSFLIVRASRTERLRRHATCKREGTDT